MLDLQTEAYIWNSNPCGLDVYIWRRKEEACALKSKNCEIKQKKKIPLAENNSETACQLSQYRSILIKSNAA